MVDKKIEYRFNAAHHVNKCRGDKTDLKLQTSYERKWNPSNRWGPIMYGVRQTLGDSS